VNELPAPGPDGKASLPVDSFLVLSAAGKREFPGFDAATKGAAPIS
jgi:hypothetical protein